MFWGMAFWVFGLGWDGGYLVMADFGTAYGLAYL
jgi:hypothetical protein